MCVHSCVHVHVCAWACRGQRSAVGVIPQELYIWCSGTFIGTLDLLISIGSLSILLQESASLHISMSPYPTFYVDAGTWNQILKPTWQVIYWPCHLPGSDLPHFFITFLLSVGCDSDQENYFPSPSSLLLPSLPPALSPSCLPSFFSLSYVSKNYFCTAFWTHFL